MIVAVIKEALRRPATPDDALRQRRRPRTSATAGTHADDALADCRDDAYTDNNDAYTHRDYARPMT